MKKIGCLMIIIGVAIISFYSVYYINNLENKVKKNTDNYIDETSVINKQTEEEINDNSDEIIEENVSGEIVNENQTTDINYTAVLEIPIINLKRGVVDSTKNFNSLNYAISVDRSSNYPNEFGNFILYAHAGNSSIAFFRNLNQVDINDDIYVYYNGIKYHYIVFDKYDIKKTGKGVFRKPSNDNHITLITCNQSKKGYQIVLIGKLIEKINY